ncbi:NAD(P)H-dependent oxidoreductase [Neptunomonas sp. XY-337]|uniref:FMN-dependent NADH-azoreductase n=1 Tax=Neptunomonas sp. XY-337 TaxID=2561897 RepID=UPI0010AA40B2|nr:NAD(P)H-dependent oxidoreductase [Neptunomonas sp. XY-337]
MKTLLHIQTSIFGNDGQSNQIAQSYIQKWQADNPMGAVVERDLISQPLPHMDLAIATALRAPADQRTAADEQVIDLSDTLIAELKQADAIVLGVPMYNFSIPTQLKAYFDLLARAGETFRYTENGPVGLIESKPVLLITTRGGMYKDTASDHQIPFVQQFLGFIGLTDTRVIYAEGLAMGDVGEGSLKNAHELAKNIA